MRAREMIVNAIKRSKDERGLRTSKPNNNLSKGHLGKADHNLIVMTDLSKLGHEDWTVITAYYAMYHSALALLAKIGLESKDHATTAAILEYFFREQISKEMMGKFNQLKEKKDKIEDVTIKEKYIDYLWKAKRARETVQYGVPISYKEKDVIVNNAREFVSKIKLVISQLEDEFIEVIDKEIRELADTTLT
ncbi:MAG: HEPN domain-containing protein [Candidatus Aenigmarchaeota archaeon]|nr:HEPN domain-containing protein [Candidatus Aenigmarchaeota archaeon]